MPSAPQPPMALPDLPAPVPTPSTPYYFVAEFSPYRAAGDGGLDNLVRAALDPAHVSDPMMDPAVGAPGSTVGGGPTPVHLPVAAAPAALTGPGKAVTPSVTGGPSGSNPSAPPTFYFADRPSSVAAPQSPIGYDPHPPFDVRLVRRDFPILSERVNGKPLVWLDNAATTQKPQAVLDRLTHFYQHENSHIHRAAHELAARATDA